MYKLTWQLYYGSSKRRKAQRSFTTSEQSSSIGHGQFKLMPTVSAAVAQISCRNAIWAMMRSECHIGEAQSWTEARRGFEVQKARTISWKRLSLSKRLMPHSSENTLIATSVDWLRENGAHHVLTLQRFLLSSMRTKLAPCQPVQR